MTSPLTLVGARPVVRDRAAIRLPLQWWRLTALLSLLAGVAGAVGIVAADRVYSRETTLLFDVAGAQDLVTVVLVVPVTALLGMRARGGSLTAFLCLPGCLAFLAYNYAIYAFSIQFGPLFLLWVALLGLSVFALAGTLVTADLRAIEQRFAARAMAGPAWFLMVVAGLFALLWLSEIVPDLLAGGPSRSAEGWQIPTNPVHVLDLSVFLPGVLLSGLLLLRRHALGYATVAGQLVWLALTCVPILLTPVVSAVRGNAADWAVTGPVGALLVTITFVLLRVLHRADSDRGGPVVAVESGRPPVAASRIKGSYSSADQTPRLS